MKKQLYFVLILIILGIIYLKWQERSTLLIETASTDPSPVASIAPIVRTLTTPYFTLEYPLEATASPGSESPDSMMWSVSYMGESQGASGRTQTEIVDGYLITITRFEGIGDEMEKTQAESDRQGIIDSCGQENVNEITQSKLLDRDTLTFFGGCLGEYNHHYFIEKGILYRITIMESNFEENGKISRSYDNEIKSIVSSLKINEVK